MKTGKFLDTLRVLVQGGAGGMGFPKYGGIGGKGGDIIVKANQDYNNLKRTVDKNPTRRIKALPGDNSRQFRILGAPGKDVIFRVPVGITIKTELGSNLGELNVHDDEVIIAKGGLGGCHETQYAGQKGEKRMVKLLLTLIADIGLVGFPNAGKSTLLRAISNARPKIASYPFTTIHPQIGTLTYEDRREIKMADLPGLIEGAWFNVGMGHEFLRHVERTKLLLFFVDINGFKLGPQYPHRTAIENVILLNKELELFNPELIEKPAVLILNKMDTPGAKKKYDKLIKLMPHIKTVAENYPIEMQSERFAEFSHILCCSAKSDLESVLKIKEALRQTLDEYDGENQERDEMLEDSKRRVEAQLTENHVKLM